MSSDTPFIKRNRPVTKVLTQSYTRPADTAVYASGDVVANSTSAATILTFSDVARQNGGGAYIHRAVLIDSASQTTKPEFELYLFDTAPVMENDNAAWDPSDTEIEACVGYIPFSSANWRTGANSGNGLIVAENLGLAIQCAAGSKALYGILVARNAYTPISAEKFTLRLFVQPD